MKTACRLQDIVEEFNRANVADRAFQMQSAKHMRSGVYSTPPVVEWPDGVKGAMELPRGSVVSVIARRKSGLVAKLQKAIKSNDLQSLEAILQTFDNDLSNRRVRFFEELYDLVEKSPVFCDLIYDRKLLAPELCLFPENQQGILVFPWNGGYLEPTAFKVMHYHRSSETSEDSEYDVLLILSPPFMSEAEQEGLFRVKDVYSEINISPVACCALIGPMLNGVMACLTLQDWTSDAMTEALNAISATEHDIASMEPQEFARHMLCLRREAMEANAP